MKNELENIKKNYKLKELELNALLEITQSINNNLPEESLYRIYNFILRSNLKLKKAALFVKDIQWACKVNFGTEKNYLEETIDLNLFLEINSAEIKNINEGLFSEFDKVIPIRHKEELLAIVVIGGYNESSDKTLELNLDFIRALSNIIIVAIENKKLARKEMEQQSFQKELEIARNVQQFLFPKNLPDTSDLKVFSSYLPHSMVGGDYFDFIQINENKFLICIADVSGKGIPAALLMSNFQASLRTLVRQTTKFERIIKELNYQILQNSNGESFITFFAGLFDRKKKIFKYVNAGHNPPFFFSSGTGLIQLETGTTVLGIFHPLPFINIGKISKLESFSFFSYTDGLIETFGKDGEPFGTERLLDILKENYHLELPEIHSIILNAVISFNEEADLHDDITMLSCQVNQGT